MTVPLNITLVLKRSMSECCYDTIIHFSMLKAKTHKFFETILVEDL